MKKKTSSVLGVLPKYPENCKVPCKALEKGRTCIKGMQLHHQSYPRQLTANLPDKMHGTYYLKVSRMGDLLFKVRFRWWKDVIRQITVI